MTYRRNPDGMLEEAPKAFSGSMGSAVEVGIRFFIQANQQS